MNNTNKNNILNTKQHFSPSPSGNKTNNSNFNSKYKTDLLSSKDINLLHYNTSSKGQNTSKKQFNIQPNNLYKSPFKTKKSKEILITNKMMNKIISENVIISL